MKEYYDRRAPEYDDWYSGIGLYADRERPSWDKELRALRAGDLKIAAGPDLGRSVRDWLLDPTPQG